MTLTIQTPTETSSLFSIVQEPDPHGRPRRGVDLHFHAGQARAWRSRRRIVAIISGSQGGKTSFGPWWLAREIEWCGPGDYLAVTATFDLFKLKMLPAIREVFEDLLGIARYWSGDQVLELCEHRWDDAQNAWVPQRGQYRATRSSDPMWGRVILRSAVAKGGLESATAKAAWPDEAGQDEFSLTAWEAILRRLALSRGRVLITTTPYNLGWLKQQVYDPWVRGDPDIDVIQFPSVMNPAFSREEYEDRQRKMDGWKFRMFYGGLFDRPAGLIYQAFVDAYRHEGGHKVAPFTLPARWPRYLGVDPGGAHVAKVWLAHDPDDDLYYLYRERLDGDKSTAEHAAEVRALETGAGERVVLAYVGQPSESQVRRDWEAAGLYQVAPPPTADVESGIDTVISLFKEHRLYVFDDCLGVQDELATYQRKLDENGQPTDIIQHKERYHRLDALRYVALGVAKGARARVGAAPRSLTRRRR
ncbi:MAG: terminase [Anaerolineae bacterium]|nr:terminase [Anaerolineae bacterium]